MGFDIGGMLKSALKVVTAPIYEPFHAVKDLFSGHPMDALKDITGIDTLKNLGSVLTFGAYHPNGQAPAATANPADPAQGKPPAPDSRDDVRFWHDTYAVKPGDTVESIAKQFGTTAAKLTEANSLDGGSFAPDQELVVPPSASAGKASGGADGFDSAAK